MNREVLSPSTSCYSWSILVGGVLAWKTGRERGRLWTTFERLSRKTGDLAVGDPSKVYVQALKTGDPMHFAWRVCTCPTTNSYLKSNSGNTMSAWSTDARDFIARVRFREDEQGRIQVYTQFHGGSSRMSLGDEALARLVHGRWDKIRVEQLGLGEVATIEPDQPAVLLKLTMPDDMQAEARKGLPPYDREKYVPTFFEIGLDPEKKPKP